MSEHDRGADLAQRLASLSPEKRALLALRLKQRSDSRGADVVSISEREDTTVFPLSFAQERLWFLSQWDPASPVYNIAGTVRIVGRLDEGVLRNAFSEIVRRHEVLRSTYSISNGEPTQTIHEDAALALPLLDLSARPDTERDAEVTRLANQESRQPFDLGRGPLLRATLLKLGDELHALLFNVHHIVADGWSVAVLVRELGTLYEAFLAGRPSPLPPLSIQYADFAAWQREWLEGPVLESQLDYWKRQLAGSPGVLELPTDKPRPPKRSNRGGSHVFDVPTPLQAGVAAVARRHGATPFMVLLAAFQVLLHRYSGLGDICVGTPIANRNRAQTEGLIGCFVNTLVLRSDLSADPSFGELVEQVRGAALEGYDHQDLPFEMLVDRLQVERSQSHNPLFQVMFALLERSAQEFEMGGLRLTVDEAETQTAKFDLMLEILETSFGYRAKLEYSSDLFERVTIERMAGHFLVLLESAVHNSERRISSLPLLREPERGKLLVGWNPASLEPHAGGSLARVFEEQVERTPEATAVVYSDESLSFRELNERAGRVAHHLRERGVGPETLVGLCLERSLDTMVGVLGILKAGGAYVPIEPSYPTERIQYMLGDAGMPVILTQETLRDELPEEDVDVVAIESAVRGPTVRTCDSRVGRDTLAYVIYTSGSTGRPKGVMVSHGAALSLAAALKRGIYARYGERKLRASLNAPLAFDASVQQIVALLSGHALVVIPQEVRQDGRALLRYVRETGIDVLDCVPSQLKLLLAAGLLEDGGPVPLALLPGGEAIDPETWRALAGAPDTETFNMYGITECAVDSVVGRVKSVPERPTIGRPLSNTRVYVLDTHMAPVPVGVPGELYVGGLGVGRGYVNQPGLTAERFVPDPFSAEPGARLYRTGDVVRYLPDGNLDYLGRADGQVKVRGFRIELGEIEVALKDHGSVREAVVVASDDTAGGKRLVGYVVAERGATMNVSELRRHLKKVLPEYMVPAVFMVLESLPLTPNGKVDRRALPSPDGVRPDLDRQYFPPRTSLERYLVGVWEEVLKLIPIGIHDDFFELGGDSIQAAILTNRLSRDLEGAVELSSIYTASTVLDQCAYLSEQVPDIDTRISEVGLASHEAGEKDPTKRVIETVDRGSDLQLSFAQERLWVLEQLEPGTSLYNVSGALQLRGELNTAVLERSLNEIVRRHEVLRSRIRTVAGRPKLEIVGELTVPLRVEDVTHLPEAERESEALSLARRYARVPFDLSRAPLVRALLVRVSPLDHILVLTMHHIVSDGWSVGVLVQEFGALYEAFAAGEPSPLPDLPIQYVDYSHWQRKTLSDDVVEREVRYWEERLAGSPALLQLPTDRPRPSKRTHEGAIRSFELPLDLWEELKALGRREIVTPFVALFAGFQVLLHRFTGERDICVGTPVANRNRSEIEALVGFFVNTVVLRTDLSGNPTFRELLRRVKDVASEAFAHHELPFERVVQALQPERDLSHAPLFQVMFTHQPTGSDVSRLASLEVSPLLLDGGTSKFDLTVSTYEYDGKLRGFIEYDTQLFDATTIERFVTHYERLLEGVVKDAGQRIASLPLIPKSELARQLTEWNDTAAEFPRERLAHQLFEEHVERRPDAEALVFRDRRLSYRQLDERANRIAHYLRELRLEHESRVGICVPRSVDAIVAILGTLKAGYAYVPLDPDYPKDRLAYMLMDSGASVLLTLEAVVERLPPYSGRLVLLDGDSAAIEAQPCHDPGANIDPDQLAYVIYTSGSTGRPKGTLLQHRGLTNLATTVASHYAIDRESRVLLFASLSFDASVADMFAALANGATLCLADDDATASTTDLYRALRDSAVTTMVLPPSVLEILNPDGLPTLHTVVSAGERCSAEVMGRWTSFHRFVNAYGPTEATVCATTHECSLEEVGPPPIGRPIDNVRVYVLDPDQQPVPVGVSGELLVGGVGLARGYWNRPELTAEKFVPDPFSGERGARLYRTGDLVRYRSDGSLDYLGRIDHQVKVRGFRIEPGEIESVLREYAGVRDAVAVVRENETGHQRLVAYVVSKGESKLELAALRAFVELRVPKYMVPSVFVELQSLPLTPNGKVDRRALPDPDESRLGPEAPYQLPRTPEEKILAGLWAEVLGLERVGVEDNFFELGGDSILAIQVTARANAAGLRLTPRQVFEFPTVSALAAASGTGPVVKAEQGVVEGEVPLTPIQRWFVELDLPEPHHWNQALLFESRRRLDPSALEQAVSALLEHHDALRLRLERQGEEWIQTNAGIDVAGAFQSVDLTGLSQKEQVSAIERTAAAAQGNLDHRQGPLVKVVHFDLGPDRNSRLMFAIHHLAVDGVSWRILMEDLLSAYEQATGGERIALPAKTTSFKQWAERLLEAAQSGEFLEEYEYWSDVAQGHPVALPLDFVDGANVEALERYVEVSLSEEETRALVQDVPAAYGTDIVDALLAALAETFGEWTGSRTLLVNLEGHGRESLFEDVDLSRTVGWFTSMFPVRLGRENVAWPGDVLKSVKEHLRSVPRRGIGYGALRYLNGDPAISSHLKSLPQPKVSFNYLGQFNELIEESTPFTLAAESPGPARAPTNQRPHVLGIDGGILGGVLQMKWSYSEGQFRREMIERVASAFVRHLREVITHCQTRESVGYTPSDFPNADLSQEELDAAVMEIGEFSRSGEVK